jgi:hypothetical protein
MSQYPQRFALGDAPPALVTFVRDLVPRLLAGSSALATSLRAQYEAARIDTIELSGVGLFADFVVPAQLPPVVPPNLSGGDAWVELSDAPHGAGCILFVRNGYLETFEAFTYEDAWTAATRVLEIRDIVPLEATIAQAAG